MGEGDEEEGSEGKKDGTGLQKIVSSLPVDHLGTTVYLKGWRLEHSARPPLVIVHELGEHAELYRQTAESFALAGYTTYVFDLRGHGRSGRKLGHAPSFKVLVKDLLQVAAWVKHKEGGRAPVLLGHGIGALITMEFTKHHGGFCRAAILSAPCLEPLHETSWLTRTIIKGLAEVFPTYRLSPALFPRFARALMLGKRSLDSAGETGATAPKLTAMMAQELLLAITQSEARFIEYHGSVLILCPERDQVVGFSHLKKSAALHDEHNLRIADLADTDHHVFTGTDEARDRAVATILPWLETATADLRPDEGDGRDMRALSQPRPVARNEAIKPGASKE